MKFIVLQEQKGNGGWLNIMGFILKLLFQIYKSLVLVVQRTDNAIQWIDKKNLNHFEQNKLHYPLDSDLSGKHCYLLEQPGPGLKFNWFKFKALINVQCTY